MAAEPLNDEVTRLRERVADLEGRASMHWVLDLLRAVGSARSFETALAQAIEALCTHAGWTVAESWVPDASDMVLELSPIQYARPPVAPEVEAFLRSSREIVMQRGSGLAGRVWQSQLPEWIEDVSTRSTIEYRRVHEAKRAGLHATFATPVVDAGTVVAVLVFYMPSRHPADRASAELVATVASELAGVLARKRAEATIARQAREILELATPVLSIQDGVLLAPILGSLDSSRVEHVMSRVLGAIVDRQARVVLLDVTAVPTIDTSSAKGLLDIVASSRLVGAKVIVTGLRPALASALAQLGVDMSGVVAAGSLAAGLDLALRERARA